MPGESHGKRVWKTRTRADGGRARGRLEPGGTGTSGREDGSSFDWAPREAGGAGLATESGAVDRRVDSIPDSPAKPSLKDRVLTKAGERIGNKLEEAMDAPATEFINGQPVLISKAGKKGVVSFLKVLLGIASGLGGVAISVDHDTLMMAMDQINVAWASLGVLIAFVVGAWRVVTNLRKHWGQVKENGLKVSATGGTIVFYRKAKGSENWEVIGPGDG